MNADMNKHPINILYERNELTLAPTYPPSTILKVHAMAIILDSLIISILVKYKTSQETIMALIDFTVEKARTGNATPGSSHTVRNVTGFSVVSMWG